MNQQFDDSLDRPVRETLGAIVAEGPAASDRPIQSLEVRRSVAAPRSMRPMLVAAGIVLVAGAAITAVVVMRSDTSNTIRLVPEVAARDLAEAQALLDEATGIPTPDPTLDPVLGQVGEDATGVPADPAAPGTPSIEGGPVDPSLLPDASTRPDPGPPPSAAPAAVRVFDVSGPGTVTAGGQLRVQWTMEDPAGTTPAYAKLGGPSGFVDWCPFPMMAERIGTILDTMYRYQVTCDVPEVVPNGSYTVFVSDLYEASFEIVGGSPDNEAPTVSEVNVQAFASRGESITITWRATDPSGVGHTFAWLANGGFAFPDGTTKVDYGDTSITRVSGNEFDGVYSQTIRFTDRSPLGTYVIYFSRHDRIGNRSTDQQGNWVELRA